MSTSVPTREELLNLGRRLEQEQLALPDNNRFTSTEKEIIQTGREAERSGK